MRHCQRITAVTLIMLIGLSHLVVCSTSQCPTLYLLNIEPYPSNNELDLWDRAYDLIPAGHLAAEQVNNRSDLLTGHNLKLIDIESEACGLNIITEGITNLYRELVNPNRSCIVGIIGLFCSPVTSTISPIISHPNIGGYVHIAASTSPAHRGSDSKKSSLFHIIGSSSILNQATLALMHTYNWRRITSVHTESHFYFSSTADDFIKRVLSNPDYELVTRVHNSPRDSAETFSVINSEGARISYWSVNPDMAAYHLCEAFWKNFTWPGYVYIFQEYYNVGQALEIETRCTKEELLMAMEGIFVVDNRLYVENDTQLVSGVNYSEFQRLYSEKLKESADIVNETLQNDVYANSLYDQVWAFALAINNSLQTIRSQNLSLEDYGIRKRIPDVPNILRNELKQVTFQGASGLIDFSENQESPTYVNILQIQKGKPKLIGVYDPYTHNVTLTEAAPHINSTPPDTFQTVYHLLPLWLGVCMLVLQGLLFGLITTNLLLILKWRSEQDIKATSPLLSSLMIIGCYLLCISSVFLIAHRMFMLSNIALAQPLCYLKPWTSVGIDLILGVLFLKLLRIHHVFKAYHKTSRYWSNQYLVLYALAICAGKSVLLIVWNCTDTVFLEIHRDYVQNSAELPSYVDTARCRTSSVWLGVIELYSGVLLFLVVILAVATRRIKLDSFKDTKKVNAFTFLVVIIVSVHLALWIFFHEVGHQTAADISEWLPSFSVPLMCQMCLFMPKTLPLAFKKIHKKFNMPRNL